MATPAHLPVPAGQTGATRRAGVDAAVETLRRPLADLAEIEPRDHLRRNAAALQFIEQRRKQQHGVRLLRGAAPAQRCRGRLLPVTIPGARFGFGVIGTPLFQHARDRQGTCQVDDAEDREQGPPRPGVMLAIAIAQVSIKA